MRALLSVSDKRGIVDLAAGLHELGVELIATGGTYHLLAESEVPVERVADLTGLTETLEGRVKTLHPAVFAGILARRNHPEDVGALQSQGIVPIDMVVVNFYPFASKAMESAGAESALLDSIDIGGPALLRAGAKNYQDVIVLCDPDDYEDVLADLMRYHAVREKTRRRLAAKAFARTSAYDSYIAAWFYGLAGDAFPSQFTVPLTKLYDLRYGENLHQQAALYSDMPSGTPARVSPRLASAHQLHGKELSFNNYLDLDAAWTMVQDFSAPAVAIVKHTNPTGLAAGRDTLDAYHKAYSADPVAAYGGIVGFNRLVDEATARAIVDVYFEAVIAPGFDAAAIQVLSRKKAIRLLSVSDGDADRRISSAVPNPFPLTELDYKRIDGGFLVQTRNEVTDPQGRMQVVTQREPTLEELTDLLFAWRAVKHVKSNAIVLAKKLALVGVGAGQMSRVNAVDLACRMAGERAQGAVMASDAYFPFPDGVERAAEAGVTAAIQPGGSIRDREVIEAANRAGMAMLVTGLRHFKH